MEVLEVEPHPEMAHHQLKVPRSHPEVRLKASIHLLLYPCMLIESFITIDNLEITFCTLY